MKNQKWQGALRPAFYLSSQLGFILLLAAATAFSQQQKMPAAPGPATKPISEVASETNERIAELAQASDIKQGEYVIGSGDLLGVEVFDVPELSRDVRVNETGYISLPLMPTKIRAAGLTPFQLQDKLAELLADKRTGVDAASHRIPEGSSTASPSRLSAPSRTR